MPCRTIPYHTTAGLAEVIPIGYQSAWHGMVDVCDGSTLRLVGYEVWYGMVWCRMDRMA